MPAKGFDISYTLNGVFSIGLSRSTATDLTIQNEPYYDDEVFSGIGWAGFISYTVSNELRKQPFGVEISLILESIEYTGDTFKKNRVQSSVLGLNVSLSKRLTPAGSRVLFLLQASGTYFTYTDTTYEYAETSSINNSSIPYSLLTLSPAFVIQNLNTPSVFVEPALILEPQGGAGGIGIPIGLIF